MSTIATIAATADTFLNLNQAKRFRGKGPAPKAVVDPVYGPSAINDGEITVYVGTHVYSGWMSAQVTRSLDAAASEFSMTSDGWTADKIPINSAVQVHVDGEPVLTGWLERVASSVGPKSHTVTLSGRSKTCDLVDCSARTGTYAGLNLQQIGAALAKPYRVNVKNEVTDLGPESAFRIQPGETPFEALERQARTHFLLLTDTPSGDLLLTRAGASGVDSAANNIVMGGNVLSAQVSYDYSGRFSEYTLRSQGASAGEVRHREIGDATDDAVTRYRNLTVTNGGQLPGRKAQDRAAREKSARIGKSLSATYELQGWRAPDKKLWRPNMLVSVWDEYQGWNGMVLLVTDVTFNFANDGRQTTTVQLKPRQAYEEPEKVKAREARGAGRGLRKDYIMANFAGIRTISFAARTGVQKLLHRGDKAFEVDPSMWLTQKMKKDLR